MTTPNKPAAGPVHVFRRAEVDRIPERPSRVLVAEDEHLIALQICSMLTEIGLEAIGPVGDGNAALSLARTAAPHIALLDIRMPIMDGLETAKALMSELGTPSVIVSAHSTPEYSGAAGEAGVFGYLVKPVLAEQLRVTIDVSWHRYREQAAASFENGDLRRRMDERRVIEQAKWALVEKQSMKEPEAMRQMQERARSTRQPLIAVAKSVLEHGRLT
ncbi:MAG: response regulator [Phycisphaeraceae bacterium]|nr:response regulator [Phycisphaeraceae bacterium]MBX3407742.1 response regulator [Phycisphaeraceae bacterium]